MGRKKEFPIGLSVRYLPLLPGFAWRNGLTSEAQRGSGPAGASQIWHDQQLAIKIRGERQRGEDVRRFEIREVIQNLGLGHPGGKVTLLSASGSISPRTPPRSRRDSDIPEQERRAKMNCIGSSKIKPLTN